MFGITSDATTTTAPSTHPAMVPTQSRTHRGRHGVRDRTSGTGSQQQ
jgi:hypothetical protein